jgi:hypothetical protein
MIKLQAEVGSRLRIVPMEDITVERSKDLADGSYVVHWREKGQGGFGRTGSCIIASEGTVREFRFDKPCATTPAANPAHSWYARKCQLFHVEQTRPSRFRLRFGKTAVAMLMFTALVPLASFLALARNS